VVELDGRIDVERIRPVASRVTDLRVRKYRIRLRVVVDDDPVPRTRRRSHATKDDGSDRGAVHREATGQARANLELSCPRHAVLDPGADGELRADRNLGLLDVRNAEIGKGAVLVDLCEAEVSGVVSVVCEGSAERKMR